MSGALVLMPSFQPGNGNSQRGLDHRRPHDRERQARSEARSARRCLRVRVGVGKAPELRALHADLGQLRLDELALHLARPRPRARCRAPAHPRSRRLLLGLVEKAALTEGVARAVPRLLDHVQALGDLAVRIPVRALELVGAREREVARIVLLDEPGAAAGHVTGAGVQQRQLHRGPCASATRFCTPKALTSSASSSGGLKSTTPETLTTRPRCRAATRAGSASSPQNGWTTSPATGVTFSRKNSSKPRPVRRLASASNTAFVSDFFAEALLDV